MRSSLVSSGGSLLGALALAAPLSLSLLVVACGAQHSALLDEDSGTVQKGPPPPPPDNDAGGCPSGVPTVACTDCAGNPIPIECVDGNWECPAFGCPIQIQDAGYDACSGPNNIACPSPENCPGAYIPSCNGGVWTCVWDGEFCDDAGYDGGYPDGDPIYPDVVLPPPPPLFSCGDVTCNPLTSYCQINTGGAADDAGTSFFGCEPLPATCEFGGSCACVEASSPPGPPNACDCVEQNGDVVVTCVVP